MPRFFVTDGSLSPSAREVTLSGEDARHISLSLRMAAGEELTLSDGEGNDYLCRLQALTPTAVAAEVLSCRRGEAEPPFPIYVYMAYPKGDKLEFVIEKAVELGAAAVCPFLSSRCVRRPAAEKTARLTERDCRIARAAAGQCGRAVLPRVEETLSFEAMLARATAEGPALFCYEGEGTRQIPAVLSDLKSPRALSVIIGAEGGFSPEEAAAAQAAGCHLTGLGRRILRCETAPLVALSCVGFYYDFT